MSVAPLSWKPCEHFLTPIAGAQFQQGAKHTGEIYKLVVLCIGVLTNKHVVISVKCLVKILIIIYMVQDRRIECTLLVAY